MTGIDDWSGKTVLIVGGSGGMGRATAQEFAEAGANIAIADIATENLPAQYSPSGATSPGLPTAPRWWPRQSRVLAGWMC